MILFPEPILARLSKSKIVAGLSVEDSAHAVPICEALLEAGVDTIELTLRSDAAMDAVEMIAANVPEILLGVGTILRPDQAVEVKEAGADFGVSPGLNPRVVKAAAEAGLPFAPGICTPSDLEAAVALGCRFVKFFPAEASGGLMYLRSMSAPYKHLGIQYFPLGGLNATNMLEYLKEQDVPTIGGSWIVNSDLVRNEDWAGITANAAAVVKTLNEGI